MIKRAAFIIIFILIFVANGFADTSCVFFHRGQQVTAITNGTATESTLTLGQAVGSRSWKDNDQVSIGDGTGYKKEGLIDEASILTTDTTIDVDNGAGALVTDIEKVGRSLDFDALRYAQAANNTIHDITTQDIGISAWVRADTNLESGMIISKLINSGTTPGYHFYINSTNGKLYFVTRGTGNGYYFYGNTNIKDNKWHQIGIIFDRNSDANTKIYLDGYEDGTTNKVGTISDIDNLTNSLIFTLGMSASGSTAKFDGQIRDVILAYPADIMAAGEMGASGKILELATNPRTFTTVNHEDAWALYDNAATTVVASTGTGSAPNNLVASANTSTFSTQEAFISKNLIADGGMEQGGIGAWTAGDAATTLAKNTTTVKFDTRSLKITNGDATQAFARQTITTANGEDYRFHGWFRTPATPNGASQLVDVDGTAALGVTVTQAGATVAATWYEVDFTFEAADTSTTIDLGSGSITSAQIGYWDNVKIQQTLTNNPGMEGTYVSGVAPGWGAGGTTVPTLTESATMHSGAKAQRVSANINSGAFQTVTLNTAKYYTLSAWVKATSGTADIFINFAQSADFTTNKVSASVGTTYTKISTMGKPNNATTYIRIYANVDSQTFIVDGVSLTELDQLAPSTSTPSTSANSFGTGKWSDSLGAFINDGLDTLTYPNTNLTSDRGTMAFWAKINSPYNAVENKVLLDARGVDDNNRVKIFYQASDDKFTIFLNGQNRIQSLAQVNNNNFFSWHHFVFAYDFVSDRYSFFMDGASIGTDTTSLSPFSLGANNIYVGSNYDATLQSDTFFDDVFFFKRELTLNEVKRLYALPRSANFRCLMGGW